MAFKVAGRLAFRAAMAQATPVVLEPISRLRSRCRSTCRATSWATSTPAAAASRAPTPPSYGRQTVVALVPTSEIQRYAIELRSLTGGRGRFRAEHDHYDVLPAHLVATVKREMGEEA